MCRVTSSRTSPTARGNATHLVVNVNVNVDVDGRARVRRNPEPLVSEHLSMFGFQRLDVYRCAILFLPRALKLAESAGSGNGGIADQLRRAALSIPLNIAEGTGRFEKDERRFYTTARGSALECAAVLDALEAIKLASEQQLQDPREMLFRIVSMLTKLIKV